MSRRVNETSTPLRTIKDLLLDDRVVTPRNSELLDQILEILVLSEAEVRSAATNLYDRWPNLPFEDKRQVVEAITDKIVITHEDIDISFLYAPTSEASDGLYP
jgi:site-specific DNA recombinase